MSQKPLVAITMGDAAGIGAEVIVKALSDSSIYERCNPFLKIEIESFFKITSDLTWNHY